MHIKKQSLASGFLLAGQVLAIELDPSDVNSVKDAAKIIATSIVDRYGNASINGLFGHPYYFWESGLTWDSLINYWHQTGDDSYNDIIAEALRFQLGSQNNYMPENQTATLGNDDQSFWALAAMTAAEYGFPSDVLDDLNTTWAAIATTVFNNQAARWDEETCAGGLRWQIFSFNAGYSYKNTMSNGNFYQLANRLALFTGNSTYTDWADRVYDWTFEAGLIGDVNSTSPGAIYDGASVDNNCSQISHIQWTANAGTILAGEAYAWNLTQSPANKGYIPTILSINATFASSPDANGTLIETACSANKNCNTDQLAFRAILARALAQTRALVDDHSQFTTIPKGSGANASFPSNASSPGVPAWSLAERIDFILKQSALGAAAQCSGGVNGTTCGSDWGSEDWDGTEGLGQDLSALNVILANLPQTGRLGTVNSTAGEAGEGVSGEGSNGTEGAGGNATAGDGEASTGAAGRLVGSAVGVVVGVGVAMVFL